MTSYAAYGTNLDPLRMGERCPHSPLQTTGWLTGWRLTFGGEEHGWDGALATIVQDPTTAVFVAVYDVMVVGKTRDGEVYAADLASGEVDVGDFADLAWARTGLLGDEDVREAAGAMEPGRLAVLIVYENTWAIPFVAAARESGGELIAGARIPAQDVMDALEALEAMEPLQTTT